MDSANLEERMKLLEERLNEIEKKLNSSPPLSEISWPAPPIQTNVQPPAKESLDKFLKDTSPKSGNWLGIIAVLCFVFAAGFIIKLSIETGWLTPTRQIVIAALFGILLVVAGFVLIDTYRSYASLLPATGVIVLYLTAFAAHRFYELISFQTALSLTLIVSGFCIWLYWQFKHDIYAIVASIGAYISPVILDFNTTAVFTLYYFLCCSLGFATISVWLGSRITTIIAAYLAILFTFLIGINLHQDLMIAIILAAHFVIFAIGTYFYTLYNHQQLTETEAWSFLPILILFYALEYYLIDRLHPGLAPWLSLLFAVILNVLYISAKKWFPDGQVKSQPMIFAFTAIVFFHSVYLEILPINLKPWLFVIIVFSLVFLPVRQLRQEYKTAYFCPALIVFAILVIEYLNILSHLLNSSELSWLFVATAAFISIWMLLLVHRGEGNRKDENGTLLLGVAHILAIAGLYRLADAHGSLAVSSCWLFYAIAVMGFAYYRKDKVMAHSALMVLGLAAGKALLYDAASTPTTVRIMCLLLTGVVLYGAGFLMKKIADWKE